jgi:hypothetical protein
MKSDMIIVGPNEKPMKSDQQEVHPMKSKASNENTSSNEKQPMKINPFHCRPALSLTAFHCCWYFHWLLFIAGQLFSLSTFHCCWYFHWLLFIAAAGPFH